MQPSHELQNVDEVLTLVSKHPHGVMAGQIKDAYKGVSEDVKVCFVHLHYCWDSLYFLKLISHSSETCHPLGSVCKALCSCTGSCFESINNDLC